METEPGGASESSPATVTATSDPRLTMTSSWARRVLVAWLQFPSVADRLPWAFQMIVNNAKMSAMILIASYVIFFSLWMPFWLLSFVLTEWGVYAFAVGSVFFIGRSIIRMIAFPGASQRVTAEIEGEFARYSARMILSSTNCIIELTHLLGSNASSIANNSTNGGLAIQTPSLPSAAQMLEIPALWRRIKTFRNRVLAVYLEVLLYIHQQSAELLPGSNHSDLTRYGNNKLAGDVGNLSGLTPQARQEGRELMDRLKRIVPLIDDLEESAKSILETPRGRSSPVTIPDRASTVARQLFIQASELRDFVSSLKVPEAEESSTDENGEDPADSVRRKVDGQNASAMEAIKAGLASILPMLDPPPHTSIFGLDVQRGCMMSRYRGARQFWVPRPSGGMIDVIHFRARNRDHTTPRNRQAVLYCNPNAGLIEVATGMSLVGGNVPSGDTDSSAHDQSWADYYTELGLDVYVFNYAGYGRSFGRTLCASGRNAGDNYRPGVIARMIRILRSCFLTFQPTPDTLRADGIAVAHHLIDQIEIQQLIVHGESIGGVAASATGRQLSSSAATSNKISMLICDRTFCNLEAVAQRLVGGWTGYAIRALAPFWNTDVAGDFLAVSCSKVIASDAADVIISDAASLKSGIALWKELRRGIATTKGIGWIPETPLQYRMADFDNVCVNDSRYVSGHGFLQAKAPTWPADKHVSLEEAFHFAACCKRIGKIASKKSDSNVLLPSGSFEVDDQEQDFGFPSSSALKEAWLYLACCNGLTGSSLGVAVKRGFDASVAWLCSGLVFGGQTVVSKAEKRMMDDGSLGRTPLVIQASDFDDRPLRYEQQETEIKIFPKPIPEVLERLISIIETNDESIRRLSHEFTYVMGMLQYMQARLSATLSIEFARQSRSMVVTEAAGGGVGSLLNLRCGHNNPFSKDERERLRLLMDQALRSSTAA